MTIPQIRRLWAVIREAAPGRNVIEITGHEPDCAGMKGALLLSGMLAGDKLTLSLDIISDPKADPALTGPGGPNGWTPMLAGEADGTRTLLRVVDWYGGKGDKPALGYIGSSAATALVTKADAFNFNSIKRVDIFAGQTGTDGIADIAFVPPFTAAPAKVVPFGIPNVLAGPIKAEVVAGSVTKSGCKVRVTQQTLLSGVIGVLAGATAQAIAIEA